MTETTTLAPPVVRDDLSADEYHADKTSISSSGLRALLSPGCPAQFKYDRDNPQAPKKEFDLGHAAHLYVLGEGPELEVIDFPDWRKKDAQIQRDEAYLAGKVPLLVKDHEMVLAMAEAIRQHPIAGPLFTPGTGKAEQSIYWTDPATGVRCRVRPDWLRGSIIVDYKGLALDTQIPTVDGWKTMRDLAVGDRIFDGNGQPCQVTEKSEVHMRRCYRIRFDDGSSVICDDEHLWVTTAGRNSNGSRCNTAVRTTEEIRQTVKLYGQNQHRVQVAGPLNLPPLDLPIHPYVLGCWLGDGTTKDGRISKPDAELFDRIADCGYTIGPPPPSNLKCPTRTIHGLRVQLRQIGLLGHKIIPPMYLRAGYAQRLELLRGLMDTDGSWNATRHQAVFTTTDKALAHAVRELACSLGQRAIVHSTTQSGFGVRVEAYQVTFTPVGGLNPFALSRKADKVHVPTDKFSKRRVVVAVEDVPTVPTQCIAVDSPDHTYLCTEAMIPTHNTIKDAAPDTISRAIKDRSYHQQDAFYIDGVEAAGLAPDGARFIFVFQSKIAPYLITVRELTDQDRDIGRARNEKALRIYSECVANDHWPDWTGDVTEIPQIGMPTWDTLRQAEEYL